MVVTPFNIFKHASSDGQVHSLSSTITVDFFNSSGSTIDITAMKKPCQLVIPRDPNLVVSPPVPINNPVIPKRDTDYLFYHSFNVSEKDPSIHIRIVPNDSSVQYHVYVKFGAFPNLVNKTWDYFQSVPIKMSMTSKFILV